MREEMKQLDELEMTDLWPTASNRVPGPDFDPSPERTTGSRLLAAVVAFAVFGAAAVFAFQAFGDTDQGVAEPSPAEAVTFTFSANNDTDGPLPSATMSVGGRVVYGQALSFGWDGGIVDTNEFDPKEWVPVPPSAPMVVDGDAETLRGWVDNCCELSLPPPHIYEFDLTDTGSPVLPEEPGRYVIEFSARWPEGNVTFLFPIEVASPETSPEIDPVRPSNFVTFEFRAGADASDSYPSASMSAGDVDAEGQMIGLEWDAAISEVPPPDLESRTPVPAGAGLTVRGDAKHVRGWLSPCGSDPASYPRDEELDLLSDPSLPSDAGCYILQFEARWPQGAAAFVFPVQVRVDESPPPQAPAQAPAETLRVSCETDGIAIGAPTVMASPTGVQIDVSNPAGAKYLEFQGAGSNSGSSNGTRADPARVFNWHIEPGEWLVKCTSEAANYREWQRFEVVDPGGYWIEPGLDCNEPDVELSRLYGSVSDDDLPRVVRGCWRLSG